MGFRLAWEEPNRGTTGDEKFYANENVWEGSAVSSCRCNGSSAGAQRTCFASNDRSNNPAPAWAENRPAGNASSASSGRGYGLVQPYLGWLRCYWHRLHAGSGLVDRYRSRLHENSDQRFVGVGGHRRMDLQYC